MAQSKKIFIAAEIFPPAIGGPATYALELSNALQQHNFKVRILCYGRPDKTVLNPGIKINWVSNNWPLFIKYFLYFKKLFCFSLRYRTIYAMGPVASGLPAFLVKKITGKKLIVKVVGDYAWERAFNSGQTKFLLDDFLNQDKQSSKISYLQKIERLVCYSADLVITPSEYLKEVVKKWGITAEKIKVIYNAFFIRPANPNLTPGQKTEKKKGLIVSIGRLVPWKGFNVLIKIMPDLLKREPNFNLKIFGDGPEKEKLYQLIKELNLNEKVTIEKLDHDELMRQLIVADMFVLNTGYEGLSHSILEAFAANLPVITTSVGGNLELIKNNENGLIIEYNNKEELKESIFTLYQKPDLCQKFINNSKNILIKFDPEKIIKETIEVLSLYA
ncbi:MAG TPA: glycosyltransferase family 4 protein [bacterium]|nr:glycosyltransferase family 4 protein [bacterium]